LKTPGKSPAGWRSHSNLPGSLHARSLRGYRSQYGAIRVRMAHMRVYVAVTSAAEIVGTLAACAKNKEGHLRGMAVLPEWHGHPAAQQLLARAERDLCALWATTVTLDTTIPLQRAIRFYERNGFVRSGIT